MDEGSDGVGFSHGADQLLDVVSELFGDGLFQHIGVD